MAKKDELDFNLDDIEMDFKEPTSDTSTDRNPVLRAAKIGTKSALSTIWPKGKRRETILKGLPDDASRAVEGFDNIRYEVSDVLSHTKDEVLKTQRVLKQQVRQLTPTLRRYLPDALVNPVAKWGRSGMETDDRYDPQQAMIDRAMSDIFQGVPSSGYDTPTPQERQTAKKAQEDARDEAVGDKVKEAIDSLKFDQLLTVATDISRNVQTSTTLQQGVMLQVSRKQLELQFRQLFALQDITKIQQASLEKLTPALDALVKNTGLPDYAKEHFTDVRSAQLKRKVAEWVNPARYAEKFLENFREKSKAKITNVGNEIRNAMQMVLGMAADDGMGFDDGGAASDATRKGNLSDKVTEIGSSWLAKKLLMPLVTKLQGKTKEWGENNPELMKNLAKYAYGLNNVSSIANSSMSGERNDGLAGFFQTLRDLGLIDPYRKENVQAETRDMETLSQASKFDRKTWITINEVIPAWFSRLNRSVLSLAGQDVDEVYDITTSKFTERKSIHNRVRSSIADDARRLRMQSRIDETVKFLDDKNELTPEQRARLGSFIEDRATNEREFNIEDILKDPSLLTKAVGGGGATKFQEILQRRIGSHRSGSYGLSNELRQRIQDIQTAIQARQGTVDAMALIHGRDSLLGSGMFDVNADGNNLVIDRDINDTYTLFHDLDFGKRKTGRSLTREQAIMDAKRRGKASAYFMNRAPRTPEEQAGFFSSIFDGKRRARAGGESRSGGITAETLRNVLYGTEKTTFVELLAPGRWTPKVESAASAAGKDYSGVLEEIRKNIEEMNKSGIRFATSRRGKKSADGEEGVDFAGKPITANTLIGQWAQILGRTMSDVFHGGVNAAGKLKRGVGSTYDRLSKWISSKKGTGPGLMSRAGDALHGLWDGGTNFFGGLFRDGKEKFRVKYEGSKIRKFLQGLGGGAGNGIRSIWDAGWGKLGSAGEFLNRQLHNVGGWATTYPDMHVPGEKTPRIKGLLLKEGFYCVNGKPVYDPAHFTGPVTDNTGRTVISAGEIANPAFKLVDQYGREVKTPLGRMAGRVGRLVKFGLELPGKAFGLAKTGWEKLKGMAANNPLSKWWNSDKSGGGGGWFNNWFNFGMAKQDATNTILVRIYKLLNHRMAGDPEDETWVNDIVKNSSSGPIGAKISKWATAKRDELTSKFKEKFSDRSSKFKEWFGNKRRGLFSWGSGKLGVGTGGKFDRWWNRGKRFNSGLKRHRFDPLTRYEIERHLHGRDDDVANYYREHLHARGDYSGVKIKNAAMDGINTVRGYAGGLLGRFGKKRGNIEDRYNALKRAYGRDDDVGEYYRQSYRSRNAQSDIDGNTGPSARKGGSVWERMTDQLTRMVGLQEMGWFNTMRESMSSAGADEGMLRKMFNRWSKRNPMKEGSEKKDFFRFFNRRKKNKDDEHINPADPKGKKIKTTEGMWGLMKNFSGILWEIIKFGSGVIGKLSKFALWTVPKALVRGAIVPIVQTAATVASGVVAAVGWPVIIAGAVLGAGGWAMYKILTRRRAENLDLLRLAQYGFRDFTLWSSDDGAKARYLEAELKQYVSYNDAGQATMRGLTAKDVTALTEGFGIDPENKTEVLSFHGFMIQRFIPIYLTWLSALRSMEENVALEDVGTFRKVDKKTMLKILAKVKMSRDAKPLQAVTDPRKADQGFFGKLWDTVTFTEPDLLGPDDVMKVQEGVEMLLKASNDKVALDEKNWFYVNAEAERRGLSKSEKGVKEAVDLLANIDGARLANEASVFSGDITDPIKVQIDAGTPIAVKDVNAMQSLRMKAYGLKELKPSQVNGLLDLETAVHPFIDLSTCTFNGNWEEAMEKLVPGSTKGESRARMRQWFESRFLPVYMMYLIGLKRYVPGADPHKLAMTGGYLYEVALMVSRANSYRNEFRQPVWVIAINPFGEEANTDANSVMDELATLRTLSKEADMAVRNMLKENAAKDSKRARWRDQINQTGNNVKLNEQYAVNDYGGAYGENVKNSTSYSQNAGFDGTDPITAAGGLRNYANMTTGRATISLTNPGEGDYRSLREKFPIDQLNNPMKVAELVAEAAKIVGVPASVALGMGHAESGFNYRAKARSSSAAGIFQFLDGTWYGANGARGELLQYGNKYGIPAGSNQYDPYANALLGVNFIRNNIQSAERDYGGKVPSGVAYLYHFLGAGNGAKFMKAYRMNPNMPADRAGLKNSDGVISANPGIFLDRGRIRTLGEVMDIMNRKMGGSTAFLSNRPGMTKDALSGLTAPTSEPGINAGVMPPIPGTGTPASAVSAPAADAARSNVVQGPWRNPSSSGTPQASSAPVSSDSDWSGSTVQAPVADDNNTTPPLSQQSVLPKDDGKESLADLLSAVNRGADAEVSQLELLSNIYELLKSQVGDTSTNSRSTNRTGSESFRDVPPMLAKPTQTVSQPAQRLDVGRRPAA